MGWSNAGWGSEESGWYKNAGAAVGGGTSWNPADKNADFSLSGSNLIVTNTVGGRFAGVRAIAGHTTGKYYYEVSSTNQNFASFSFFGIANASASLSNYGGVDTNSIVGSGNGTVSYNGSTLGPWTGMGTSGSTMGIAADLTAQKIWFRLTGVGTWNNDVLANQNPVTGVGGYSFAGMTGTVYPFQDFYQLSDIFTSNFGGTGYSLSAPTGFGNW